MLYRATIRFNSEKVSWLFVKIANNTQLNYNYYASVLSYYTYKYIINNAFYLLHYFQIVWIDR